MVLILLASHHESLPNMELVAAGLTSLEGRPTPCCPGFPVYVHALLLPSFSCSDVTGDPLTELPLAGAQTTREYQRAHAPSCWIRTLQMKRVSHLMRVQVHPGASLSHEVMHITTCAGTVPVV